MAQESNLYKVLGVAQTASKDEIRAAYRKLAKDNHPDLHPGDAKAEEKFKSVSGAYGILGDDEKRKRYDAGEIDGSGAEVQQGGFYRQHADADSGRQYYSSAGFEDFADIGDVFSDIFGQRAGQGSHGRTGGFSMKGADVRVSLTIGFLDAVRGSKTRVTLPNGQTLNITIPAGTNDGGVLRLKGKGQPGIGLGGPGDLLIAIEVKPHATFSRRGNHILSTVPISLSEAVLGGSIDVQTVSGSVKVKIPKGSSSGKTLRLKGKGVKTKSGNGDHLLTIQVQLPPKIDDDLARFIEKWSESHPHSPRRATTEATP
jgi:DnaJ-class molecular chaperone